MSYLPIKKTKTQVFLNYSSREERIIKPCPGLDLSGIQRNTRFKPIIPVKNFTIDSERFERYLMLNPSQGVPCSPLSLSGNGSISARTTKTSSSNSFFMAPITPTTTTSINYNKSRLSITPSSNSLFKINSFRKLKLKPKKPAYSKSKIRRVSTEKRSKSQNAFCAVLKQQMISERERVSGLTTHLYKSKISDENKIKLDQVKLALPFVKLKRITQKKL